MEKKKIIIGTFVALILIGAACAGTVYYYLFAPQFHPKKTVYIYIDRDDTADSIYNKVEQQGHPRSFTGFRWMAQYKKYSENIHTGRYTIRPGENVYHVFSRLYRGYQEPTNLTVGSARTLDRLARSVGKQLMIDSAEIAGLMNDSAFQQKLGYNKETLPCLFIPETYQVYWDMSAEEFFERMQKEHQKFWNQERLDKATAIGMTPTEVCTLASIVEEETNNTPEKPMVAALHQPPAHRHAPASRPYHQICLAGLRLAENYECPSGSRIPLQYLSQHRTTSRSHTHPLTHRAGCCAEPYETQLPLHVCQRGLLGHP